MNSYHNHNIRGQTFSGVVFVFFAQSCFAIAAAEFLAAFTLRLDGFFPALPGFVGLANGKAASSESDDGGGAAAAIVVAFFADGFICASFAAGMVFPVPPALPLAAFFPVQQGFGLANGASMASSESEDGGGTADA